MKLAALTLCLLVGLTGCQSLQTDNLSLRAEQTIRASFVVVDEFLRWEHEVKPGGDISLVANKLRREYPPANQVAWEALLRYREIRDDRSRSDLEKALEVLEVFKHLAQTYVRR